MRTNPNGLNSEQAKSCLIMSAVAAADGDRDVTVPVVRVWPVTAVHHHYHEPERDHTNEHLMTQSMIVHTPFRRIRHPELTPIMPREREDRTFHGSEAENLMTQSLIMAPFRRVRHSELTPVAPRGREQALAKVVQTEPAKIPASGGPKRAFSMTRLDQLARPRQRYLEEALRLRASVTKEPLVSPTRPTSSMSTATRIGTMTTTVPYRPLTSARKPRPLSMAMPSAAAPENMMTSSVILPGSSATIERPSRSALRAKLPFVTATDVRAQSAGSTRRQSVGTIAVDGKPTPPRKPSQVKAASAARRMVKQPPEVANDRLLIKSSSSCKLNTLTRSSTAVITSDNVQQQPHHHSHEIDRTRTMRKSATNPDAISAAAISTGKPLDSIAISQAPPTSNGTARSQPVQAITSTETLTTSQSIGDLVDIPERPNSESQTSAESEPNSTSTITPTITSARKEVSQEEYRRAMAEKRRLAREQAEREAEMERERIAKERAAEEERQRLLVERLREQEEQQRVEDERNRKLHEEYEDQQRKEAEEQQRLEEEAKARDEQERKNREKAEKARLELEERLRKDEEERIARKKRLEAIMSRTRKTPTATSTASPNSEGAQTPTELAKGFQQRLLIEQTNQRNEQLVATQTPDVVEDAIKSNLINGKSELDHTNTSTRFVDDLLNLNGGGPLLTNKSNNTEPNTSDLLTRYSELNTVVATTTSNVFGAFATTNSNETAVTPGTH